MKTDIYDSMAQGVSNAAVVVAFAIDIYDPRIDQGGTLGEYVIGIVSHPIPLNIMQHC